MSTLIGLPQNEQAKSMSNSLKLLAVEKCLQQLPEECRESAMAWLGSLTEGVTDYEGLMTGAYNEVSDDCVELARQRDFLFGIVMRMIQAIGNQEIDCMRPFAVEMRHMLLEGMFFTEKHAFTGSEVVT